MNSHKPFQPTQIPLRPLNARFTNRVLQQASRAKRRAETYQHYKSLYKEPFSMNSRNFMKTVPGAAAVIGTVLVLGGTAYAAVGGVQAIFGGQKQLDNGARIVTVRTQNCPHVDAFNVTDKNRTANAAYYYKIKAGSKLTNSQVVAMVQGACEADAEGIANAALAQPVENLPANKDKLVGGYVDSVITAITPTSLSLRSVIPQVSNSGTINKTVNQKFTQIDPNVAVIANGQTQSYTALHVGDHVSVSYRATGDALTHSETLPLDQIDASQQTVVLITRVSPHSSAYFDYQKYAQKQFEQVTPCSTQPIGYCTVEQLQPKK